MADRLAAPGGQGSLDSARQRHPGGKYADAVAGILAKLNPAPVVKVMDLPGLPEKGDLVDWIDAHGDAAEPDALRAEIEALVQKNHKQRQEEGKALEGVAASRKGGLSRVW